MGKGYSMIRWLEFGFATMVGQNKESVFFVTDDASVYQI